MPQLGLDAQANRNTGSWAVPAWDDIGNVKDSLELNLEKAEADVTKRGGNGWRQRIGTLKDGGVQFEMLWENQDPDFTAVKDAWLNNNEIDCAIMDQDIANSGAEGLRAEFSVLNFSRSEPLEGSPHSGCELVSLSHTQCAGLDGRSVTRARPLTRKVNITEQIRSRWSLLNARSKG